MDWRLNQLPEFNNTSTVSPRFYLLLGCTGPGSFSAKGDDWAHRLRLQISVLVPSHFMNITKMDAIQCAKTQALQVRFPCMIQ